mmetsp:Transcript_8227/g.27638  ORF Transcript_8227/g.27638 Transcript_8227/m.27638 type:complete len:215 (-) Transcript_8227:1063-1707(-)
MVIEQQNYHSNTIINCRVVQRCPSCFCTDIRLRVSQQLQGCNFFIIIHSSKVQARLSTFVNIRSVNTFVHKCLENIDVSYFSANMIWGFPSSSYNHFKIIIHFLVFILHSFFLVLFMSTSLFRFHLLSILCKNKVIFHCRVGSLPEKKQYEIRKSIGACNMQRRISTTVLDGQNSCHFCLIKGIRNSFQLGFKIFFLSVWSMLLSTSESLANNF